MKICNSCKVLKSLNLFYKNKLRISTECKGCVKKRSKIRYEKNKQDISIKFKIKRKENKEKNINNPTNVGFKKNCYKCNTIKGVLDFYRDFSRKDGLSNRCKVCSDSHIKSWQKITKKWHKYSKNWRKNNPDKHAAIQAYRRCKKAKRTPNWLTDGHIKDMNNMYLLAKEITNRTGIKHEVDHIVPLQGADVSGLHVPWNLQILTKSENASKSNKVRSGGYLEL